MRGVWLAIVAAAAAAWMGTAVDVRAQGGGRAPGGNPTAAAIKNPVNATPDSISKGRSSYDKACKNCHGQQGLGDGPFAPKDPPPANLVDADWTYGSSDGEIYDTIANGVGGNSKMKGFRSSMPATDMWNVVNYIRSLGPKQ